MNKKDKDGGDDVNHAGSINPENSELTIWLSRLWLRDEYPERAEVYQMFGRNKAIRGEMIHHEDFKANNKLTSEQANKLANEVMEACQNDCDSLKREANYQLIIIDRNRKASPLVRRIGPVLPKRAYAIAKIGDTVEDEYDDDENPDIKSIERGHIKDAFDQVRWDKNRYDKVMGEMLILQNSIIQELRRDRAELMSQQMTFFEKLQESMDRSLDRELVREKEKFKLSLYKDGLRTARNLLPGIFQGIKADREEAERKKNDTNRTNGASNGSNGNGKKDYGPSPERTCVENFLHDIEEEGEELQVALFGDYEEENGKVKLAKAGIFSVKQYMILLGVRDGHLPVEALDPLMPQSGQEESVTQEQIKKAQEIGVTDGIGMSLIELLGLRNEAKKKQEAENTETVDSTVEGKETT